MEIRLETSTNLDKYPAKQHARRVAHTLAQRLHKDVTDKAFRHGLIYLAGTPTRYLEDSDQAEAFRQRRYFYYLSGVNESDCHLTYEICTDRLTLWLPPISVKQAVWVGRGSTTKEALRKYDVDRAHYSDRLANYIGKAQQIRTLFVLHKSHLPPGENSKFEIDQESLLGAIAACRVIKDHHEVGLLRRANDISTRAHTTVLRKIRALSKESQVEALFTDVSIAEGALQSYDIIAGSGGNGAVLHYTSNKEAFGKRQTMVLDAGAEWRNYSSDVTRTFPLNGTFTREAQDIYDLVQRMQDVALEVVRPGKKLLFVHLLCHRLVARGLLQLGILHNATEVELLASLVTTVFYPHGLGHHLGLEVHDVTPPDSGIAFDIARSMKELEDEVGPLSSAWKEHLLEGMSLRAPCTTASQGLQPGMVITVEPGIYFNRYALEKFALPKYGKYINVDVLEKYLPVGGVRIEDNFLITQSGWEVISSAPKGEEALKIIRGET